MKNGTLFALPFALALAACAASTSDTDDEDTDETSGQDLSTTTRYKWTDTKPIIVKTCVGCHANFDKLTTTNGVKKNQKAILAHIEDGAMPPGDPTWKTTKDGAKVVRWLKYGTDLK